MIVKCLIAGAAMMCVSAASAAPLDSEIIKTADGTAWYLQDSSLRPLDLGRPNVVQFWIRSDNPPTQAMRQWHVRVYLDCASKWYVKSLVAGYDANGGLAQFTTKGWAPQNWRGDDATGVIAAVAKTVCRAS
jgi:hypothetical protein